MGVLSLTVNVHAMFGIAVIIARWRLQVMIGPVSIVIERPYDWND